MLDTNARHLPKTDMITKLSFTITGRKPAVNKKAKEFMSQMGRIMAKEIDGVTLIKLERLDMPHKTMKQIKSEQAGELFVHS